MNLYICIFIVYAIFVNNINYTHEKYERNDYGKFLNLL